jgi:hypothetical protein
MAGLEVCDKLWERRIWWGRRQGVHNRDRAGVSVSSQDHVVAWRR